jgi:hypothetical protein
VGIVFATYFELGDRFSRIDWFERGTNEIDVEAAFDVPHGDAKDGAEAGDIGAKRFCGRVVVEERSIEERVEAMSEVAGWLGGFGESDEVVEGEEVGVFRWRLRVGPSLGFQVDDGGFLGAGGEGEEKEQRKDNAETQRTLRSAEKK